MPLDFTLDDRELALRASAREFADSALSGVAAAIAGIHDPEKRFLATKPFYQKMVDAGFVRALLPDEYGGQGMFSALDFALAAEELARVDINVPTTLLVTASATMLACQFGTPAQKERFLPRFAGSEPLLAAISYSEVTGSANLDTTDPKAGMQTFAQLDGDEWVINGAKHYTTNGTGWNHDGPDLLFVVCRTDPDVPSQESLAVIAVEKGTPGVRIAATMNTAGHRATAEVRLEFTDVRVPAENILGKPGDGQEIVNTLFCWTCSKIGAACVGRMRAAFDYAYGFARTDNRSGPVPIIEYQNVGYMLADLKIRIEAARYLSWKAADHFDKTGGKDRELANITKIFCSETAVQVVYDAMRLVGADAYTDMTPIAGIMNDVLAFPVYDQGNMGIRRRTLHKILRDSNYDPLAVAENRLSIPPA